jgi:hypothetical protein
VRDWLPIALRLLGGFYVICAVVFTLAMFAGHETPQYLLEFYALACFALARLVESK